ncbi:ABC transporter permease [Parafrankia discariae]|uniref:ABC transporter permease n=1 Tax=Parafrankia discariae TaxID=365528 RepID=UPI001E37B90E|nr:ABC transporter permease [Parafrankia discariae]
MTPGNGNGGRGAAPGGGRRGAAAGDDGGPGRGGAGSARLWLRWSWRDLRARLLLVVALAAVIGEGTGLYAGLTSTSRWRHESYDASFAGLHVHDLRISVDAGATVPRGRLRDVVAALPDPAAVAASAERLLFPTEIETGRPGHPDVLVRGEVVGVDLTARPLVDGVAVDGISNAAGRALTPADRGRPVGVLDHGFARANHLPSTGTVRISGDRAIDYVGEGQSPEYFVLPGEQPGLITQAGFGVLYTSLETAQNLAGEPGAVNDLVLTARPGTDVATLQRQLTAAVAERLPGVSTTITNRDDIASRQIMYDSIESNQALWNALALLVLVGAMFAAFNLVGRVVDTQRREIGIGMALGVPSRLLALRPLLLGLQIGILGVLAGLVTGMIITAAMGAMLRDVWPLPDWRTGFQAGVFARAAVVGLLLPLVAAVHPVWRAVRVEPVRAIHASAISGSSRPRGGPRRLRGHSHGDGRGGGRDRRRGFPLPGGSLTRMPARNLARAPRRMLLTALGIAAAITAQVVFTGQLDTFTRTTNAAEAELTSTSPDRLRVTLPSVQPVTSPTVTAVTGSPAVRGSDATLALPTRLLGPPGSTPRQPIDTLTYILDVDNRVWSPSVTEGSTTGGLLLAAKAAHDLGVGVGGTVVLRHPRRAGDGYRTVDTPLRVAGIHSFPVRSVAFLDAADAGSFGLTGLTNVLTVLPAPGYNQVEAMRALAAVPGVGSVVPATGSIEEIRALLRTFVGILRIAEIAVLLLALLIAYNAMSISMDERRREQATMLAFGLAPGRVLALAVAESALIGLLGTLIGLVAGYWTLRWSVEVLLADTLPDLGIRAVLSVPTLLTTLLLGVVAVAVAPLLSARRVRRMDVPSTLRVIE